MKVRKWDGANGRYVLDLPGSRGWLVVFRIDSGNWAWEFNAPNARDDVRGTAVTAELAMERAYKAAVRAGMVDA